MQTRKCTICGTRFEPVHRTSKVCSCICASKYYDTKAIKKGRKASRMVATMVGMRSMGEVRYSAREHEETGTPYEYEPDTFPYHVEETRNYTPDFRYEKTGRAKYRAHFYVEYKGVLTVADRKKAKLFREQYPKVELYFVFEKPKNKINKASKTTYGMWCDQHGFEWSDKLERKWFK